MGIDVIKMPIPEEFGAGPEYNPDAAKKKFDKPRGFGGKGKTGGAKHGNKKPFHGPKKV
jgi:hypothetical protein